MTQELFANEQFFVTVRTHNTNALIAEVSLLLKEKAGESDLLKGLAVAHICRDSLHQQQCQEHRGLSSKACVSFYETRNRIYSIFTSTKNRTEHMTFRNSIAATAIENINQGNISF